ncbi:phytanoyl-CoA dioxygenase family protein [Gillisia sp. Hel_I_29]|uniref:phytanoyl-CoA dioxygenase family protein n=1 Tax=Gillisia sp. Hel_I_29 TaxID=1249975 RepID=UPI0005543C3D|nr:phytanoyl-CoA dioxygenase family protein [Gillisia sp. Hel_I_29]
MKINKDQIKQYFKEGYLVINKLFSKEEILNYKEEISFYDNKIHWDNIISEDNEIRSIFAPHKSSDLFSKLYKDKRLIDTSAALIKDSIYLYQFKLNLKAPFVGNYWEWHQDYPYWHLDDNTQNPDMISALVYLDDTKSYQGPLMILPGSHKNGIAKFRDKKKLETDNLLSSLGSNLKYTIDFETVKKYADKKEILIMEYNAGTVVFFHPNLFHASVGNLSPYKRDSAIITYNSINNIPKGENKRPTFICSRDYEALN